MKTTFVLVKDKALAMAEFCFASGLEPTFDQIPEFGDCTFLPDTMPRNRVSEKYHKDGGNEWPDRWVVKHTPVWGSASFLKFRKAPA